MNSNLRKIVIIVAILLVGVTGNVHLGANASMAGALIEASKPLA